MSITVYVVRHGETTYNAAGIIQGHIDSSLNELGEAQAVMVAQHLADSGIHFNQAYSSDLQRAKKTGQTILSHQTNPSALVLDERMRERFLGELQGKRWGEADVNTAEPTPVFRSRLLSFWDSVFTPALSTSLSSTPTRSNLLITSHGGSIRQLTQGLFVDRAGRYNLDLSQEGRVEGLQRRVMNCSITTIEMKPTDPGGWTGRMVGYAEDTHISGGAGVVRENVDIEPGTPAEKL